MPDKAMVREVRGWLRYADPKRCVELTQMLIERNAATRETVGALFGTPMIQSRMGKEAMARIKEITKKA